MESKLLHESEKEARDASGSAEARSWNIYFCPEIWGRRYFLVAEELNRISPPQGTELP